MSPAGYAPPLLLLLLALGQQPAAARAPLNNTQLAALRDGNVQVGGQHVRSSDVIARHARWVRIAGCFQADRLSAGFSGLSHDYSKVITSDVQSVACTRTSGQMWSPSGCRSTEGGARCVVGLEGVELFTPVGNKQQKGGTK